QERLGEAVLHAAVPVPHPQIQRGRAGVRPTHGRRRGSRRRHVLPRHAVGRHGRAVGARARRQDPRRPLRERLERLRRAGLRRRRVRRRSRAERAVLARAPAAGVAVFHLSRAGVAGVVGAGLVAVGRVRARGRDDAQLRDAPCVRARACLPGVPRAVPQGGHDMRNVISHGADWDFDLLERYDEAIAEVAAGFGLDTYPNQIEIITSEQMLDAYATSGLPVGYTHWSYGKEFIRNEQAYRRGMQGLAYEIVINSNPCIAYLMEENTMTTQALVIAHASYGHNSFFKGNHLFQQW